MSGRASGGPRVRAVVVTWNGIDLIRPCLDSLLAQDLPDGDLAVVVVDNGSSDGTTAMLARDYPGVEVRALARNTGFAGGVDAGTRDLLDARGAAGEESPEYVVLLNNDAWFEPEAVRHLVSAAQAGREERVGAVTALVLLAERDELGRELVNSTGNVLTPSGAAADRDFGVLREKATGGREVFGLYGGASLIRTAALREVGGIDPTLFLYYEDTDLSWRLREHGWKVVYEPAAVARHRHAASSGTASPVFRYHNTRNSLVVAARHAPAAVVVRSALRQVLGAVRHTVARTESRGLLAARWRGLRDAARALPAALGQRRRRRRLARP